LCGKDIIKLIKKGKAMIKTAGVGNAIASVNGKKVFVSA